MYTRKQRPFPGKKTYICTKNIKKLSTILISDFFFLMLTTVYNNYKNYTSTTILWYTNIIVLSMDWLLDRLDLYKYSCALAKRESIDFNTILFCIMHMTHYIITTHLVFSLNGKHKKCFLLIKTNSLKNLPYCLILCEVNTIYCNYILCLAAIQCDLKKHFII
jgi:hypothetical protein